MLVSPPSRAKCVVCGLMFTNRHAQIYCSTHCKKHAQRERKRIRDERAARKVKSGCKTPEKKKFATEEAARSFKPIYGRVPYLCPCGWYHNKTPNKGRK